MSELTDIYIFLNSEERGPFDSHRIGRMIDEGSLRLSDRAWRPGMPDWTTLEKALNSGRAPARDLPAPEPASPKQKAFLSYMNIPFSAGATKEQAALLVNEAMENPPDPGRLARWAEERLRLHPELYASDLQAKKENRPAAFYERVLAEGAECFHDVSRAHCQVLIQFLDMKYPNWDARDKEATWDYFFPALAEKFPQVVNKAWKGRLHYPQGPRVDPELKRSVPLEAPVLAHSGSLFSAKAFVFVALLLAAAGGAVYVKKHPELVAKWMPSTPGGREPSIVFPKASTAPGSLTDKATIAANTPKVAPGETTPAALPPDAKIAMNSAPAGAPDMSARPGTGRPAGRDFPACGRDGAGCGSRSCSFYPSAAARNRCLRGHSAQSSDTRRPGWRSAHHGENDETARH